MTEPRDKATPSGQTPPSPGLEREEPELRPERDLPATQRHPAAEGAFDTDTVRPEDQEAG